MSEKQQKKSSKFGLKALGLIVLLLAAALGYALFLNKTPTKFLQNDTSFQISQLENKINNLENIIQNLSQNGDGASIKELAALNEKIENVSKTNVEMLDSKAPVSMLMGVVERVDRLESDVKNLGQVTSQSALILTAAALTNEAAETGRPFVYEASVLEELSKGTSVEKSAQIIGSFAAKGLPLREDLIEKFIKLYETSFLKEIEPQDENLTDTASSKDWKDKAINKLKTLVIIEKTDSKEQQALPIDEVYRLVREGDFETAMLKMDSDPKYQTEGFEIWKEEVRSEKIFEQEMSKIKALTLGAMKTESMKAGN